MREIRRGVSFAAIAIALGVLLPACSGLPAAAPAPTFSPPTPRALETVAVERRPLEEWADARGYISSSHEENLFFPVSGYVKDVYAHSGQDVERDFQIAELDAWDLESQLARARMELHITELRLQAATENTTPIDKAILETQREYQQFYADGLQGRLARTRLTAPFAGVLYNFDVKPGQRLEPYSVVGVLVDPNALQITALIPDVYRGMISASMPASVTLNVDPSTAWDARVVQVATASTAGSSGSFFEATLDFSPGQNAPSAYAMACTVRVLIESGPESLFLPARAIRWEGAQATVQMRQNGQPVQISVTVGQRAGDWIEITDGLSEGDLIEIVP